MNDKTLLLKIASDLREKGLGRIASIFEEHAQPDSESESESNLSHVVEQLIGIAKTVNALALCVGDLTKRIAELERDTEAIDQEIPEACVPVGEDDEVVIGDVTDVPKE